MFFVLSLMLGLICVSFAQNTGNNERYNLAVYAVGLQNDQPLSTSIQTVVQNKTITKLTGEGNYRLIERSNEFLQQIQKEQSTQQSGDVADGQIAEIGAGYGAQKICVVSVTIIDKYLYIATRIVDVATKTSYESGDAEVTDYTSIPVLTKALESALNRMIAKDVQQETNLQSNNMPMSTSSNTVGQMRADYNAYIMRLKSERGEFLEMNSMAYHEYKKYRRDLLLGAIFVPLGATLSVTGLVLNCILYHNYYIGPNLYYGSAYWEFAAMWAPGLLMTSAGIFFLCVQNKHLKNSYQYYLNGGQRAATLQFYPYYGSNNTFGAGLTLRF